MTEKVYLPTERKNYQREMEFMPFVNIFICAPSGPRVVTREKNSQTVAHACRKRRLKWVLPRLGVGAQG
jgi:hypothetical protein